MFRVSWFAFFSVLFLLSTHTANAQMSPAGQRAFRNASTAMDNVQKTDLFDGKQLKPGARLDSCKSYLRSSGENLARAINSYKAIPENERKLPEVVALGRRIEEMRVYLLAMDAVVKSLEQTVKGADDQCRAFQKEVMDTPTRLTMGQLVGAMEHPGSMEIFRPEDVKQVLETASKVKAACEKPEYRDVGKTGCSWLKIGGNDQNPAAWCEAAGKAPELVKQAVLTFVKKDIERMSAALIPTPERFQSDEGYLTTPPFEKAVTFKNLMFDDAFKGRLVERYKPLFESAGIAGVTDDALYAPYIKALDALRAVVEKTADTWKLPPPKSGMYAVDMAQKQIVKWYQEEVKVVVAVKKAFMILDEWTIEKNALGVPLRRYRSGFVVFQVPGEKYCQVRSFTATEEYTGGGNYQKASGVRFGFPRFQKCP